MVTGENTTYDWQAAKTNIAILPVGAFEQHSRHLPLLTDVIFAESMAKLAAEDLGAALLPAIPIGTSMEHTGFRGSFSLRPETLMQIIRDIADDAERQDFRILIVLNGHGGNHCLVPVCRDINRRDRPLKIILTDWYAFGDPSILATANKPGMNFHAGEHETSLMMALRPDLVGKERPDARYPKQKVPLRQADLTTFGIYQLSPEGVIGWSSEASKETGEAILASSRKGLTRFLKDRIARLRRDPRYSADKPMRTSSRKRTTPRKRRSTKTGK